jgi:hypothetical protein
MTDGGTKRQYEPRLLIPGGEALRRVQKALACDAEAAIAWLKLQVMRTAVRVYAGIHPLAYHPKDSSDRAKAAPETSRYPIAAADIVGDGAFGWSVASVDERHLKNALATELADLDQPIDAGDPPRPSVPFAIAIEMTKKLSGFSEEAARAWLLDALLVNRRIPAWCQPTQRYPAWRRAGPGSDPGQLYVMTKVLEEALAVEFPEAKPQARQRTRPGDRESRVGAGPPSMAAERDATSGGTNAPLGAEGEKTGPRPIELIDGLAACRDVEDTLDVNREFAEQWLRTRIWHGYVETWYDPWFLQLVSIDNTELGGPSNWCFDGLFDGMWGFDLKRVCITRGSLERALKIGRSAGPEDDLWEKIRLDIERRSGITEWRDSTFDNRLIEDLLETPAVFGVRFKLAAAQEAKADGIPLEIAEEALVEAVNQGMVRAWRNHPGRLEEFGPERPLRQPVDPETQIHGEQLKVCMTAESAPEPVVPHEDRSLGRPAYEYWPDVEADARQHLEYEGGETEPNAQARLAKFMKQRIVALGHKAPVRGTLALRAKKVLKAYMADKYQ